MHVKFHGPYYGDNSVHADAKKQLYSASRDMCSTYALHGLIFCFLSGFCSTETDGVTVRVECPGSETIPGIDGFLCSLDGGNSFGCKRDLGVCDEVFCDGVVFYSCAYCLS